jgi:hypothetical protein
VPSSGTYALDTSGTERIVNARTDGNQLQENGRNLTAALAE